MNYYKQGDAANADKIRAAFERNGIDTSANSNYGISNLFYYSYNGEVAVTQNRSIINIIKTHPDYKELNLPIEPKFKVGDWIVQNDNGTVSQITKVINGTDEYGEYRAYEHTNGYFAANFENEYHLWTIQDAKDGDVLVYPNEIYQDEIFLFNLVDNNSVLYYCCFDGNLIVHSFYGFSNAELLHVHPATKEQRDLLFAKMKEAGYQWNVHKKELRKIQPHYDIANFKPKQWVLVRDCDNQVWGLSMFSHRDMGCYICINRVDFRQCIPFNDDTKHLLGTTDMCDEFYVNW